MRATSFSLLIVSVSMLGCQSSDSDPVACKPLESEESQIALRDVIAVGKAALGTLYVVDEGAGSPEFRVFVSEGLALVRHDVAGSGESNESGLRRLTVTTTGDDVFTLFIEIDGVAKRMVREDGPLRDKNLDPSAHLGEELEILDEDVLQGLRVRNLPGDVRIEYSARVDEDQRLVVTRPEHDWTYEDFRLFFGPPDRVEERRVTSVERALDGGSTWIKFKVGAEPAEAFFPAHIDIPGQPPEPDEPDTLTIGSKSHAIERLTLEDPDVDELNFLCLP
jgi:hypothetical protein